MADDSEVAAGGESRCLRQNTAAYTLFSGPSLVQSVAYKLWEKFDDEQRSEFVREFEEHEKLLLEGKRKPRDITALLTELVVANKRLCGASKSSESVPCEESVSSINEMPLKKQERADMKNVESEEEIAFEETSTTSNKPVTFSFKIPFNEQERSRCATSTEDATSEDEIHLKELERSESATNTKKVTCEDEIPFKEQERSESTTSKKPVTFSFKIPSNEQERSGCASSSEEETSEEEIPLKELERSKSATSEKPVAFSFKIPLNEPQMSRSASSKNTVVVSGEMLFQETERSEKNEAMTGANEHHTKCVTDTRETDIAKLPADPLPRKLKTYEEVDEEKNPFAIDGDGKEWKIERTDTVYVVHAESPNEFYILKGSLKKRFHIMQFEMNRDDIDWIYAEPSEIEVGGIYGVLFSEDKCWYRGRVLTVIRTHDMVPQKIQVVYVDFGNRRIVDIDSNVRSLPSRLSCAPPFAERCCLTDTSSRFGIRQWPKKSTSKFMKFVCNKEAQVEERRRVNDIRFVDLIVHGWSMFKLLCTEFFHENVQGSIDNPTPLRKYNRSSFCALQDESIFKAQVSHILSLEAIYLQKVSDTSLQEMNRELQVAYTSSSKQHDVLKSPKKGMVCAAVRQDCKHMTWYRAEIIAVLEQDQVEVSYVDYGDTDVVGLNTIRELEDRFLEYRVSVILCSLADVDPISELNEKAVAYLKDAVRNKIVTVHVKEVLPSGVPSVLLRVKDMAFSLNEALAYRNFAISTKESAEESGEATSDDENKVQALPSADAVLTSNAIESWKIEVDITYCLGPHQFYVHALNKPRMRLFQKFQENLQKYYNSHKVAVAQNVVIRASCCAKYSVDRKWYRGVVNSVNATSAEVVMVDYGYTEWIPKSDILDLASQFSLDTKPPHAFRLHLAGLQPAAGVKTWSSLGCDMFTECVINQPSCNTFHVVKKGLPNTSNILLQSVPVDLFILNSVRRKLSELPHERQYINVNDWLINEGVAYRMQLKKCASRELSSDEYMWLTGKRSDERQSASGSKLNEDALNSPFELDDWLLATPFTSTCFTGRVTNVGDDGHIYIQSMESTTFLQYSVIELQKKFTQTIPTELDMTLTAGSPCIAKSCADGKWYRARVLQTLKKDSGKVEVYYVDYGKKEVINKENMRKEICLTAAPIQCTECVLQGMQGCDMQTANAITSVRDIIIGEKCTVTVHDDNGPLCEVSIQCENVPDLLDYAIKKQKNINPVQVENCELSSKEDNSYKLWCIPEDESDFYVTIVNVSSPCDVHFNISEAIPAHSLVNKSIQKINQAVAAMHIEINSEASEYCALKTFSPGTPCCVWDCHAGEWCRASVISVTDIGVNVYYVDTGKTDKVPRSSLKMIPQKWLRLPRQAIHAKLKGVSAVPGKHTIATKALNKLLKSKTVFVHITKREPQVEIQLVTKDRCAYADLVKKNLIVITN